MRGLIVWTWIDRYRDKRMLTRRDIFCYIEYDKNISYRSGTARRTMFAEVLSCRLFYFIIFWLFHLLINVVTLLLLNSVKSYFAFYL